MDAFLAMHGVNKMISPELESDARDALSQATHGDRAREDWTHVGFTVIDPRGARDHDDAVYCEASQDGWRLFVASADVAAIVQPGDRLDEEICARGKSIYLPDETIPMCPRTLTEGACSLTADEPKRAHVTIIDVLPDGTTVAKESMRPAWVKIQRTITYDEADEALARGDRELECLRACTDALRAARRAAGAIILTTPSEISVYEAVRRHFRVAGQLDEEPDGWRPPRWHRAYATETGTTLFNPGWDGCECASAWKKTLSPEASCQGFSGSGSDSA